jgi:hypothetical protein
VRPGSERGVALPVSLVLMSIFLVVAIALFRSTRTDVSIGAGLGDRAFASQALDVALQSLLMEVRALPAIPEVYDPSGSTLRWWNSSYAPIDTSFWRDCDTRPAGNRCDRSSMTRAGRTYEVRTMVQPNAVPSTDSATSGALLFFYRAAVLVTLENGARTEIETYIQRPQLVRY